MSETAKAKYRIVEVQHNGIGLLSGLSNPYYSVQRYEYWYSSNPTWCPIRTCDTLSEAEAFMSKVRPAFEKVIKEYEI